MAMLLTQRRFTVDEYYRMAETGILSPDDRVELIDGVIVDMSPPGSRHASSVARGTRLFSAQFADASHLRVQLPVRLSQRDEPDPDLALVRPKPGDYADAPPGPADVLLVVEVADSTLELDRGVKMQRCARSQVPEVWQVNLVHQVVLVHTDPGPEGYRNVRMLRPGEQVAPTAFPDRPVSVDALLP